MLAGGGEPIQLWGMPDIELDALPEIMRRSQVGCLVAKQASIMTLSFEVNAAGPIGRLRLRRTRGLAPICRLGSGATGALGRSTGRPLGRWHGDVIFRATNPKFALHGTVMAPPTGCQRPATGPSAGQFSAEVGGNHANSNPQEAPPRPGGRRRGTVRDRNDARRPRPGLCRSSTGQRNSRPPGDLASPQEPGRLARHARNGPAARPLAQLQLPEPKPTSARSRPPRR